MKTRPAAILFHHSPGSYAAVGLAFEPTPRADESYRCTIEVADATTVEVGHSGQLLVFPRGSHEGITLPDAVEIGLARIVEPEMAKRYREAARADRSRRSVA